MKKFCKLCWIVLGVCGLVVGGYLLVRRAEPGASLGLFTIMFGAICLFIPVMIYQTDKDIAEDAKRRKVQYCDVPQPRLPTHMPPPKSKQEIIAEKYQKMVDAYNDVEVYDLDDELLRRFHDLMEDGLLDANREMYHRSIK